MQDKELEKILQEKADKIEMREFSEVWDRIKDKVAPEKKEKKSILKNKFFLAFVPSLLAICIVLTPFLFFKPTPPEEVFYSDELTLTPVTKQEAFDGLLNANITHADLSGYTFFLTSLYHTEKMEVKGAYLEFYNENPATFIAKMGLYDKSVDLKINMALYDTNCKVNSANVFYKFKSADSGFYEYSVYATHNKVKYVIEYSGITDNLMEFLTDFFA